MKTLVVLAIAAIGAIVAGVEGWWSTIAAWDVPSPPYWLRHLAFLYFQNALTYIYWLFFIAGASTWLVLRFQRRPNERQPAKWLRIREICKALIWLALGLGRIWGEWSIIIWGAATVPAVIVSLIFLFVLIKSYWWDGRAPVGVVVDDAVSVYAGPERRSGRERRRNWWPTMAPTMRSTPDERSAP